MIHYLLANSTIFSCISLRVNWQILSPMWRQNEYAHKVFLNDRDKSVEINSVRLRVARYTSIFCCRALHVPIERFLLLLVKRRKIWLTLKHILFSCSLKKSQSSAFPCFEKAFPLKYSYSSYERHHISSMLFWLFPMRRSTFSVAYNLRVVNFFRSRYREEKWWRHKNYICELMELVSNIQIKEQGE